MATWAVVEDLLYYLWACDEHVFKHPRMRLQLAWSIILSAYAGLRPGEFIESSRYRGTNQGLKYGDVEILWIERDGVPIIHLKVTFQLRKNQRRDESK